MEFQSLCQLCENFISIFKLISNGPLEPLCNEMIQWIWQAWCSYAVNQFCLRTSDGSKSFLDGEAEAFMNYSRW
jgi:hypothetical protein